LRSTFYFDLGSPYSYLAAERINALFDEPPEWQPVLLGALFRIHGRDSWANGPGREEGMREVERRAAEYGLPPIRWPDPWPGNTLVAMRAATFAKHIGKVVSFSLAGFRQAFAAT
jgi:2-hydroxychromene-2-carboxylate isomerase